MEKYCGFLVSNKKQKLSKADIKKGREDLKKLINQYQVNLTRESNPDALDELLDRSLYQKSFENSAHSNALLDHKSVCTLKAGDGSDANRCTVYGVNVLLGAPYFLTLR